METTIHTRSMLVSVSLSVWQARRLDKRVTAETNRAHGASAEAGRYRKHLLGGPKAAPSHAAAIAAAGAIRTEAYRQTLPWADEGWRLLPTANFERFAESMRAKRAAFESAVDTFLFDYPELRARAERLLNGMFVDSEYPTVESLRGRFSAEITYAPVPAFGDFRLDLGADVLSDIERATEARVNEATNQAMRGAWDRLAETVSAVRDKLADQASRGGKGAIFRDSLIDNVRATVDILGRLNVTGDPELERMRERAARELGSLDPEALRSDKGARADGAARAARILETMGALYGSGKGGSQ